MSATTWCGSLLEKVRCVTSPTLMPLNETLAPVGEARDRTLEDDLIIPVTARGSVARDPHDEQKRPDDRRQSEGADQDVVGARLHRAQRLAFCGRSSAATRGGPVCGRREADHAPLTVEIGLEPRVVGKQELADRTGGDDLLMPEHRDPVADRKQAVEIVRDHEDGQAQGLLQRADEIVEIAGRNGIESRGRFVEKDDLRVERERPRQRNALGHAAGQLGGQLVGGFLAAGRRAPASAPRDRRASTGRGQDARASAPGCSAAPSSWRTARPPETARPIARRPPDARAASACRCRSRRLRSFPPVCAAGPGSSGSAPTCRRRTRRRSRAPRRDRDRDRARPSPDGRRSRL